MTVDLMNGGNFIINESDIKTTYFNDTKTGIILEFNSGFKVTIKCNDDNIKKWEVE
jgi:hypothetical protein